MDYLIDLRFEDQGYNAIIHFVTTLTTKNEEDARTFFDELLSGINRRNVFLLYHSFFRIDNDPILRERSYEYFNFCISRATASIQIDQFILEDPDQSKSLTENMINKFFSGENSTATFGKKYNIPVRVLEKGNRNPISGDFYYFAIEQLIPRLNPALRGL